MAESICAVTEASGAAIALAHGAGMVCVASTGTCAIEVGASIDLDRGLAAKCVLTGEVQHCRDSEHDPGVNREACRDLGVRSMVMMPLQRRRQPVAGVLSVFAERPAHFTARNLRFLEFMAGLVLEAAERGQGPAAAPEALPPGSGQADDRGLTLLGSARPSRRRFVWLALPLAALAAIGLLWPEVQSRLRPPASAPPSTAPVRASKPAVSVPTVSALPPAAPDGRALLTGIRYETAPGVTRVLLDIDRAVVYRAGRLDHPSRVYLDLADTRLALPGRSLAARDPLLDSVRVAQNQQDVARVVLDLKAPADYSITLQPTPPRLVIELRAPASR